MLVIGGGVSHKGADWGRWSLAVFSLVLSVQYAYHSRLRRSWTRSTRSWRDWVTTGNGFTLRNEWVQGKRLREPWRKEWTWSWKSFRNCNGVAVRWSESTRCMGTVLRDRWRRRRWRVDSLTWTSWLIILVNFNFFHFGVPLWGWTPPHLAKVNDYTEWNNGFTELNNDWYHFQNAWHSVTGQWWTLSSLWNPQLGNKDSLGNWVLNTSYLGQPNVSRLREGMFRFSNKSFSTWPPLYSTTVLLPSLHLTYMSWMSLTNCSSIRGSWKCSAWVGW